MILETILVLTLVLIAAHLFCEACGGVE